MAENIEVGKKPTQEEKIWAAVSYIWLASLIALASRKNNEYVKFHASQGAFIFVCSLFIWVPVIGWLLGLVLAVLAILGIIKSLQGEKWPMPVVAAYAQKLGNWVIKTLKF